MALDEFAHQTIDVAQTPYQNALADALEKIFSKGAKELPEIVKALNEAGVKAPDGKPWTDDSFRGVMAEYGN